MILGYAARNALTPKVNPEMIAKFQAMAQKESPSLAAEMPNYHEVGGQIAQRIDTLDPERRRVAHADLNDNLLEQVAQALASGTTGKSVQAIRGHLEKLATQYGVPIPQMGAPDTGGGAGQPLTGAPPSSGPDRRFPMGNPGDPYDHSGDVLATGIPGVARKGSRGLQVAASGIPGYPNLPPYGTPMPPPTRLESPGLGAAIPIPPKQ